MVLGGQSVLKFFSSKELRDFLKIGLEMNWDIPHPYSWLVWQKVPNFFSAFLSS
jgi:hypothetical protein